MIYHSILITLFATGVVLLSAAATINHQNLVRYVSETAEERAKRNFIVLILEFMAGLSLLAGLLWSVAGVPT